MKNGAFEYRIKYWRNKGSVYENLFDPNQKVYRKIEEMDGVIFTASFVPEVELLTPGKMVDFIDGLALMPFFKDEDDEDSSIRREYRLLTRPVLDYYHFCWHGIDWEHNKLDAQYMAESEQTTPIQRNKIIKIGILESLHEKFNDEIFSVNESDFITAINDPENFGNLIIPLKGKKTYMYFLLGQISSYIGSQHGWEKHICKALRYDFETYYKKKSGNDLDKDFILRVKSIIER